MGDIMWFERSASGVGICRDENAVVIGDIGVGDWVRVPTELAPHPQAGQRFKIARVYMAPGPLGRGDAPHYELEGSDVVMIHDHLYHWGVRRPPKPDA